MTDTVPAGLAELCDQVKQLVPKELGEDAWYLLVASILTSSPTPTHFASLYTHLTTIPSFSTFSSQEHLSLRLRDVLLKQVTLVGAPQVLCALIPFARASAANSDPATAASTSTLSPQYDISDPSAIKSRGVATIDTIYGSTLLPSIFSSFGAHSQDVQHMELFTVYGMYLSDFTLLTPLETELVVFISIMCTGLHGPSLWHMRGMGRLLGARGTDESGPEMGRIKDCLRNIKVAAMSVVEWCGSDYVRSSGMESEKGWPNVGDVVRDLGGWGEDAFEAQDGSRKKDKVRGGDGVGRA